MSRVYEVDLVGESLVLEASRAMPASPGSPDETPLARAQRTATCNVRYGIHVLGADATDETTVCQCGSRSFMRVPR